MQLPFNTFRAAPALKDLLDVMSRDIFLTLNCHALGTVRAVTPPHTSPNPYQVTTVTVAVNYQRTVLNTDGSQVPLSYPLIADAPVISLCGGSAALTFPIAIGDQALILFNDRDMDNWMKGATDGQVNSPRLHSFSDAIAIVGLNSMNSVDAVRALLTDGTVKLGINPDNSKVTFTNGTTLLSILQDLIAGILGLTTPSGPVVDSTGKVSGANTALGNLLE